MPKLTPKAVKRALEGVLGTYEKVPDDVSKFAEEFASGTRPMYRMKYGRSSESAREKALRTVMEGGGRFHTQNEPKGLYFALDPDEIVPLILPGEKPNLKELLHAPLAAKKRGSPVDIAKIVKAHATEGTRVKVFSQAEWEQELSRFKFRGGEEKADKLTDTLKKHYDVVIFPDIIADQSEIYQAVVLNSGKVSGKLGNKIKMLGAAGVAGAASILGTSEESEAGGKLGSLSRASKALKGMLFRGREISEVRVGKGNWRQIIFNDGSEEVADTKLINYLCRKRGTLKKMQEFESHGSQGPKIQQALKSLEMRRQKQVPLGTRTMTRGYFNDYVTTLKREGEDLSDHVFVTTSDGMFTTMPKPYAEILEEIGKVKIMKTKADLQALKPRKK